MSCELRATDTLQEATSRHHRIAHHLADLLAIDPPDDIWLHLEAVLADIPALAGLITRQGMDLAEARLNRANLAAAALAVIAATRDGEPDPLSYLRDELQAQGHPSDAPGNRR